MLAEKLKQQGIHLEIRHGKLIAKGALTDDLRSFIRQNKPALMAELETHRIPESVEAEWKRAIHPLDLESQGRAKIHWVTAHCPELGVPIDELEAWHADDLRDIAALSLEHTYRLILDYVDNRKTYRRSKPCM